MVARCWPDWAGWSQEKSARIKSPHYQCLGRQEAGPGGSAFFCETATRTAGKSCFISNHYPWWLLRMLAECTSHYTPALHFHLHLRLPRRIRICLTGEVSRSFFWLARSCYLGRDVHFQPLCHRFFTPGLHPQGSLQPLDALPPYARSKVPYRSRL